ncbi:DUF1611 domain-containing protein [Thermococcus piezophilus]|uniref:DUF1611 domain-containing protein n=1 Tax=Thermococcus piezophilus TaxID=1712654 RepID=UPI002D21C80D|nr:DUF1611 domain-containing protein [Thermococcus piezophilus]
MLHPAYPCGFELIAAGRPDYIVLQHAPARKSFDDFPQYPLPPLDRYIQLVELLSGRRPIAITINSQGLTREEALEKAREIEETYGILTRVPLYEEVEDIARMILDDAEGKPRTTEEVGALVAP